MGRWRVHACQKPGITALHLPKLPHQALGKRERAGDGRRTISSARVLTAAIASIRHARAPHQRAATPHACAAAVTMTGSDDMPRHGHKRTVTGDYNTSWHGYTVRAASGGPRANGIHGSTGAAPYQTATSRGVAPAASTGARSLTRAAPSGRCASSASARTSATPRRPPSGVGPGKKLSATRDSAPAARALPRVSGWLRVFQWVCSWC